MAVRKDENYFLAPGHVYRSSSPIVVRTVVGNGVCVCLWNERLAIGAMSHFTFPIAPEKNQGTTEYGNISTYIALRLMRDAGIRRSEIVAQIIGGASHAAYGDLEIGIANIAAARECLERNFIPIYSEDVGGGMGRKVSFDTATGNIVVMKVHQLRREDWEHDGAA